MKKLPLRLMFCLLAVLSLSANAIAYDQMPPLASLHPVVEASRIIKPAGICSDGVPTPMAMGYVPKDSAQPAAPLAPAAMEPTAAAPTAIAPAITPAITAEPLAQVSLEDLNLTSYEDNYRAFKSVENSIELFSERLKERFSIWLSRSGRYVSMMRGILREEGIPEAMVYLPLIESGFSTSALSPMRAAGPWQFIPGTAKRYGLTINKWVDERRDPVKSTRAAARYLRDLYGMFGSWSLAMAGYNAGEGKVIKAIAKTNSTDFWRIYKTRHLKWETKDYVPRFIAASLIAYEPQRYGLDDLVYEEAMSFDEVAITRSMSLNDIAARTGVSVDEVKRLNPEIRRSVTPPVNMYTLRVPSGMRESFMASLEANPPKAAVETKKASTKSSSKKSKSVASKSGDTYIYKVRKGDTLWNIARNEGVSFQELMEQNSLTKRSVLRVGQKLEMP